MHTCIYTNKIKQRSSRQSSVHYCYYILYLKTRFLNVFLILLIIRACVDDDESAIVSS